MNGNVSINLLNKANIDDDDHPEDHWEISIEEFCNHRSIRLSFSEMMQLYESIHNWKERQ